MQPTNCVRPVYYSPYPRKPHDRLEVAVDPMSGQPAKTDLEQRIATLRAQRGDVIPVEEVGGIVLSLMAPMAGEVTSGEAFARHEVADLLKFLRDAKAEIANIRPNAITRKDIPAATDELDAVIKATETATLTILNSAETLSALAPKLTPEQSEVLNTVVTEIYEASTFQDISGQRIGKVIRTLRQIEDRLTRLAAAIGAEADDEHEAAPLDPFDPQNLLAGPALPDGAASQDDIDALFDKL
jgi:chemotaxis protein CheZ